MNRYLFILLLFMGLCLAVGCEKQEEAKAERILKLAHGLNTEHPVHKTMVFMAERVKEKSGGRLIVEIYPSEQLGTEKECIEALQLGYLAMTKTSTGPLEGFVPELKVFGVPYLFRDAEHFWKVARGPIGKALLEAGVNYRLKGLCYFDAGARSFYAKKPINTPADLKGLKVRVMKSVMATKMIDAMGGSPTPIAWGELYTSLDQGVVDAAENNPPSYKTSQHYKICNYYSLDEHTRLPDMLLMSTRVWDELSEEFQQILTESIEEAVDYNITLWAEAEKADLEAVKAEGVEVIYPDKEPFRESVRPIWKEFEGTEIGQLIEQIQEVH